MQQLTPSGRASNQPARTNGPKRAVLYLRVSSAGQVKTDYDPEGLSIPAQRKACQAKATELGAVVIDEYVEPGRSATNTDNRPKFMEMMARIKAERDVELVVVYARSRLHRNVEDAAITRASLRKLGVQLVSVMDYTDDSYIGDLVATIIDGVNEYQSRASGADIRYKMGQKAKNGGTVSTAKIGYLNVREEIDGRRVATVTIDSERAPFIRMAFELYATGKHSFRSLHAALTEAGLRTRATAKRPSKPISLHKLGAILRDRYYLGVVTYDGQQYPGRHQPLISQELFDRVQRVLDIERRGGTRDRVHDHYLKALLWCARCQRRLIIMRGKSRNGALYFYYLCRGRQEHACDLPYLPVSQVEDEVVRHYATVRLSEDFRTYITSKIQATLTDSNTTRTQLRRQIIKRLADLTAKEEHYFDLVGNPDWPQAKLSARMRQVAEESARLRAELDTADLDLTTGQQILHELLELLAAPQQLYARAGRKARRTLNKAIFTRLYLDGDEDSRPAVASDELNDSVAAIVRAERQARLVGTRREDGTASLMAMTGAGHEEGTFPEEDALFGEVSLADLVDLALGQRCSSKAALVGLTQQNAKTIIHVPGDPLPVGLARSRR
jgi:DNA invertase Pin-like site-specific DNA recombinase